VRAMLFVASVQLMMRNVQHVKQTSQLCASASGVAMDQEIYMLATVHKYRTLYCSDESAVHFGSAKTGSAMAMACAVTILPFAIMMFFGIASIRIMGFALRLGVSVQTYSVRIASRVPRSTSDHANSYRGPFSASI
jgi:uncharacterized membrane protein YdfJ with MMPL/SSD domain